jgi:hypothetical protein
VVTNPDEDCSVPKLGDRLDVRPVRDNLRSVILLGAKFRLADALENGNGDLAVITRE